MIACVFQKYPEISHSNYLQCCSNLLVKFAIFKKVACFWTVSIVFSDYKQNFTAQ